MMLSQYQVNNCKLEDLVRLCKYLGINRESDFKRSSMVNWLVFNSWVRPEYNIGRMY